MKRSASDPKQPLAAIGVYTADRMTVSIAPTFLCIFRSLSVLFLMTVIIVVPIGLIAPDASLDNLLKGIEKDGTKITSILLGVIVALSSIITLFGRRYGIQVSTDLISGRSESGDLVEFPTASVDKVWRIPNQYATRLVISSSASTEQISTVMFGLNYKKLRQEFPIFLGQDHPLSTFFSA